MENYILITSITIIFSSITSVFYYKNFFKKDIATSIIINSLLVFNIVYFVSFENNIGLGIGLLGILSLIRLRSTLDNLFDISFIFYAITIGLLNASLKDSLQTILIVNSILTIIILVLSIKVFSHDKGSLKIILDEIDTSLLQDSQKLKLHIEKTHKLKLQSCKIKTINHLKDSTIIEVILDDNN